MIKSNFKMWLEKNRPDIRYEEEPGLWLKENPYIKQVQVANIRPYVWNKKEETPLSAVRCYPDKRIKSRCRVIMDTIADGYSLLAAHYPQYVKFTQIEGGADNDA